MKRGFDMTAITCYNPAIKKGLLRQLPSHTRKEKTWSPNC